MINIYAPNMGVPTYIKPNALTHLKGEIAI